MGLFVALGAVGLACGDDEVDERPFVEPLGDPPQGGYLKGGGSYGPGLGSENPGSGKQKGGGGKGGSRNGGGSGGGSVPGDSSRSCGMKSYGFSSDCIGCIDWYGSCCDMISECAVDARCSPLLKCFSECDHWTCMVACRDEHEQKLPEELSAVYMSSCISTSCGRECGF